MTRAQSRLLLGRLLVPDSLFLNIISSILPICFLLPIFSVTMCIAISTAQSSKSPATNSNTRKWHQKMFPLTQTQIRQTIKRIRHYSDKVGKRRHLQIPQNRHRRCQLRFNGSLDGEFDENKEMQKGI